MRNEIPRKELIEFFRAIEAGEVRLRAERDPQEIYAGDVVYHASNGWMLKVFNDCNEYDYVDEVQAYDGRVTDFDALEEMWEPQFEVAWRCLGIPGYCTHRCTRCGAKLPRQIARRGAPYVCEGGKCAGMHGTWIGFMSL